MDIAAMSMQMSLAKVQQGVSIAVTKNAMDFQETQSAQMLEMLDALPQPASYGRQLDVYV